LNPVPSQPALPAAETLQFRKVEVHDDTAQRRCTSCSQAIPGEYFHVAGAVACPGCAQARLADRQRRGGWPEFVRAALFGLGAAIAGSLLFAIVAWAVHARFGLLAIVVGVMVGKAVLMGSRGSRGRRYQVLAVLLTYGAITTSYVPEILSGLTQARSKLEAQQRTAGQPAPLRPNHEVTAARFVLAMAVLVVLALAAPLLLLLQGSGFIGLIIIGIGLLQAWRLTRPDVVAIMGPYTA
jgi:hypothetical protein